MRLFLGRVQGKREKRAGRRKERGGGAEKALHHQEPRPKGRRLELYILAFDAPSLSLILLESTTQQKNLLKATTQPLSSSQASSLPSQHLSICHYWRFSLTQWPALRKRHVLFNAVPAAQSFQSMGKPEQGKILQVISSSADRIPNTSERARVKSDCVQEIEQPLFNRTQLRAVVCTTKQSPPLEQQLSEERQNISYLENTSPPTCCESLYLCSAFKYFPKNWYSWCICCLQKSLKRNIFFQCVAGWPQPDTVTPCYK